MNKFAERVREFVHRQEERNAPCWKPCLQRTHSAWSSLSVRYDEALGLCRCFWADESPHAAWMTPGRVSDDLVRPERR